LKIKRNKKKSVCLLELEQEHTYELMREMTSGNNYIKLMESSSETGLFCMISSEILHPFLVYLLEDG